MHKLAVVFGYFEDLAVGSGDMRLPWVCLLVVLMPDGHAFIVKDAAVLICNLAPSADGVEYIGRSLEPLERWTVVRLTEGTYP